MATPVWIWPPNHAEPTLAGTLAMNGPVGTWHFDQAFVESGFPSPDPLKLSLSRGTKPIRFSGHDGLPGVVRDAMPQGYGADRIVAQAGRTLSPMELLEMGLPDSTGALEVCTSLDEKRRWQPGRSEDLEVLASELEAEDPPSRAIRRLNGDVGTSQGGEKPKTTVVHRGELWLAKMRDRGGLRELPAREFVTMTLAGQVGIPIPKIELKNAGAHQIFLIRRFDRHGDPLRPARRMVASAHTVLDLGPAALRGEPARSYLVLADKLRRWAHNSPHLQSDVQELWQRMAFNALVGNTDDHPRNHAFLHDDHAWRLSPAYDITPTLQASKNPQSAEDPSEVVLSMDVSAGKQRTSVATVERLLFCAPHFGLSVHAAGQWLLDTAGDVATKWESLLLAHLLDPQSVSQQRVVDECRPAFGFSQWIAEHHAVVEDAVDLLSTQLGKRRR